MGFFGKKYTEDEKKKITEKVNNNSDNTYEIPIACSNCHEVDMLKIERGTSVKEYLKDKECKKCGIKGLKKKKKDGGGDSFFGDNMDELFNKLTEDSGDSHDNSFFGEDVGELVGETNTDSYSEQNEIYTEEYLMKVGSILMNGGEIDFGDNFSFKYGEKKIKFKINKKSYLIPKHELESLLKDWKINKTKKKNDK